MSQLGTILQEWANAQPIQPVSDAALGRALGVTRQTVGNWKAGLTRLPEPRQLRKVARVTGRPYQEVLEAALVDAGYLAREALVVDPASDRGPGQVSATRRPSEGHGKVRKRPSA